MNAIRGQALVEYMVILVALVAALCLPLAAGGSVVDQLEAAMGHFWQAWRGALLALEAAAWC